MAVYLDSVPMSGIIRIRDMMYAVERPFRLDQGDVSFDAPETVKEGMRQAIDQNRSHYLQTTGLPRLLSLIAAKLRGRNRIPVERDDEVMVTNGGIHALYLLWQAALEPGDEVLVPDPEWPPAEGTVLAARGVVVRYPLHEARRWRPDVAEMASLVTPRTRAIYLNSPNNPTGGVLSPDDLSAIAALARERDLLVVSDEAYEDVVFEGSHASIASLPGMHERTVSVFTFSKSYAMTGLRLGYIVAPDPRLRDRIRKGLFFTTSNVSSVVQYGGIAGLEGSQEVIGRFRSELADRRDLFYRGLSRLGGVLTGAPPAGAFYAFVRLAGDWKRRATRLGSAAAGNGTSGVSGSASWEFTDYLIRQGRVGCVPGVDFGPSGEGFIRFCFSRERDELEGALEAMRSLFA